MSEKKFKLSKKTGFVFLAVVLFLIGAGLAYYRISPKIGKKSPVKEVALSECQTSANAQKNTEAEECYKSYLDKNPADLDAKAGLAAVESSLKKYSESSKLLQEVTAGRPNDSYSLNSLANSLRDQGKTADAEQAYVKAIAAGETDSVANLVTLYNIDGSFDKSIALLNSSLAKTPADKTLLQLLASTYSKKGDSAMAEKTLKKMNSN